MFSLNNEEATFNICRSIKQSGELQMVCPISYKVESVFEVQIEEQLGVEALECVFLGRDDSFPIIIALELNGQQVEVLMVVLKRFK